MVVFQRQVVFLLLSFDLSEREEVSVCICRFWGIFGSDIKRRTSLCLAKVDLSHKCCVAAVASCLVFFRSDWVPC